MADQIKYVFAFVMSVLANFIILQTNGVNGSPQVPCYFIFGDSLVDSGNNNPRVTIARANYRPYGIDFPGGIPTGRFTNGRTSADVLGKLMGFVDFIPPFTTATGNVILKGVNYGSGSSGIRDDTGFQSGSVVPLKQQLFNHHITVQRITAMLRNETAAQNYLNKCLYTVGMGYNDYLISYFLSPLNTLFYTPEEYAQTLIDQYRKQIMTLYDLGARKVALFGVWPIGCSPFATSIFSTKGSTCVNRFNDAVQIFNGKLAALVDELNSRYSTNAKFIYVNTFGIVSEVSTSAGFAVTNAGCCQAIAGVCVPFLTPCQNRTTYVYWDSIHPTEAFNEYTAARAYDASRPSDTYPIDIKRLAELQL